MVVCLQQNNTLIHSHDVRRKRRMKMSVCLQRMNHLPLVWSR